METTQSCQYEYEPPLDEQIATPHLIHISKKSEHKNICASILGTSNKNETKQNEKK